MNFDFLTGLLSPTDLQWLAQSQAMPVEGVHYNTQAPAFGLLGDSEMPDLNAKTISAPLTAIDNTLPSPGLFGSWRTPPINPTGGEMERALGLLAPTTSPSRNISYPSSGGLSQMQISPLALLQGARLQRRT